MLFITVVVGPDQGKVFKLPDGATHLVGRQTGSVPLNDNKASRRHAELTVSDGRITVTDLGSSNGTFINQQKLEGSTPIPDGAMVQFGQSVCVATWVPETQGSSSHGTVGGVVPDELLEAHQRLLEGMNEVRGSLTALAARAETGRGEDAELRQLSLKLDAVLDGQARSRAENPATAQQWSELCSALAALAPASDPDRLASVIRESLAGLPTSTDPTSALEEVSRKLDVLAELQTQRTSPDPAIVGQLVELHRAVAAVAAASNPQKLVEQLRQAIPAPVKPADVTPTLTELQAKLDAVSKALASVKPTSTEKIEQRLEALAQQVSQQQGVRSLEAKVDALAAAQAQAAWPYSMIAGPLEELRQAVTALAPAADQRQVIEELRQALKTAVDPTPVLAEVQRRLESLMIYAARPQPAAAAPSMDTEVHAKLDALLAVVARGEPLEEQPQWIAPLHEAIAAIRPVATDQIEQRLEAIAQAVAEPAPLDALEAKLDAILEHSQNEPEPNPAAAVLESKLDAVLRAIQSAPAAVGIDAAVVERLDALVATAHTESMESTSKAQLLEQKLDDLLAIVAANVSAPQPAAPAVDTSELDVKLDAVLQGVQALSEAMLARDGVVTGPAGEGETLLLQLVERIDALASAPRDSGDVGQLIEEVRRHSEALDERLMQHLRGTSEASENQMRAALVDLTEAVRAMTNRSDRAVMEQVLTELRGKESGESRQMLREVHERVRKLPASQGAADPQAIALAVRDAVVTGFPTIEANAIRQLAEQLRVLPDRLNNAHILGDIFSTLRTLEQNQKLQAQWMQAVVDRLDAQTAA